MQQNSNQKTIIIATIAFIVGFGLAWFIAMNKSPNAPATSQSTTSTASSTEAAASMPEGKNYVSVKDQPQGVAVALESVGMEKTGWVVIHEDDNGAPGKILGAQLFDAGTVENATVDLLRGTLAGKTYYAMIHLDNGDRAFDPKKDTPVVSESNAPVMVSFKATE